LKKINYRPIRGEEVLYFDEEADKWQPGVFIMDSCNFGTLIRNEKEGMFVSVKPEDIRKIEAIETSNPNAAFKKEERE